MSTTIINSAKNTILIEAQSIQGLVNFIDDQFIEIVNTIHNSNGRVIISGIGKSAIVGQKIVSTFNSTGTPALFLHAADAIHGDLGMIQKDDVVIVISKSGESPEIKLLVPLIKGFGNKLIAITGNLQGYLANNVDYVINSTVEQEACPINLAPTSSTTAQMVMGDALAVVLMELKGFKSTDFAKFHPGGNLGKRLYLRVDDLYNKSIIPKVLLDASLKEIVIEITKSKLGATAVVDENNIIKGIITDGDLRRMLEKDLLNNRISAKDICSSKPKKIDPSVLAVEALEQMRTFDISQLLVVDNNQYLGILQLHDLVREGIV